MVSCCIPGVCWDSSSPSDTAMLATEPYNKESVAYVGTRKAYLVRRGRAMLKSDHTGSGDVWW
jgi:hypothetical protein